MARFVVVTPNPAVDVTYGVDRQRIGETIRVSNLRRVPGGKGINAARVLHQLGRDVIAVQPLGGATGQWISDTLAGDGIDTRAVPIAGETRTTVTVDDRDSHPTLYAEPGPTLDPAEWRRFSQAVGETAGPGDWVIIAGSFPAEASVSELEKMINEVRRSGARVLVDTSGPLLLTAADAGASIVKANRAEAVEATGHSALSDAVRRLASHGSAVMISLGTEGSSFYPPGEPALFQSVVPGIVGNPTGAGDAATAGLVAALADGHDTASALAWAAVCGGAAVQSIVAGDLDLDSLNALAARLPQPPAMQLRLPAKGN
jgi:tagatose 6-phosphate kinase